MTATKTTQSAEARPPVTTRQQARVVKENARIEDYAGMLTELKGTGRNLRGDCPVHGGDNPTSFSVDAEKQLFHCFSCGAGGDVIDLYRAVEGGEVWEAIAGLSLQFGIELPRRGATWLKWSGDKTEIKDVVIKQIASRYQRRFTRVFAPLVLVGDETPSQELEALDELARALWPVCFRLAGERVNG